jgi:hypothetical protein
VLDPLELATVAGTWVLVVGTLAFAYWQMRQAQRLHSSTTLLDLRERFYSARLRQARRNLSAWLLQPKRGEEPDDWELGIFFELIGALTRNGVLEKRFVWSAFGTWITAYYTFLKEPEDLLTRWRKETNDPLIFAEFEWLALRMLEIDQGPNARSSPMRVSLEDARSVLESESRLRVPAEYEGPI